MQTKYFKCECLGGKKTCGYLGISNISGGLEFFWTDDKRKKGKVGVYLQGKKSIKILKDLISSNN